ncbi:TPA: hypothetical protein ACSRD7_002218 [Yersinia enterocolitica]|nr:hypothetical protein [Yersinia enterocolitica]HEN3310503.1 hypothetical protein [Yersinia enterocolitica]
MSKPFYDEDRLVDIYWYDKIDYYYLGKEKDFLQRRGQGLPFGSTDIPIPDTLCQDGYIYVFENNGWVEKKDIYKKITEREVNYVFSPSLPSSFDKVTIDRPECFMPAYYGAYKFTNAPSQALILVCRFHLVQDKFIELVELHEKAINQISDPTPKPLSGNLTMKYRFECEGFILSIRTILDELTQLTYMMAYKEEFKGDLKVKIDSIGLLFSTRSDHQKYDLCRKIILGDGDKFISDNSSFINAMNELFNSIKHSALHHNSMLIHCLTPNVQSFYIKQNDYSKFEIIHHNHNLFHVIFGFIDNFQRIIHNQKVFLNSINVSNQ